MSLLTDLVGFLDAVSDRRGREWHCACPECGAESSPRDPHCSFGEHGWHCFVCSAGGSLADLAKRTGLGDRAYSPPAREHKELKPPSWMAFPGPLLTCYESFPERVRLWQAYKLLKAETIYRMRLGVGALPACACHHPRLVLPVFDGTMLVGLRGRRLACHCPQKWTVAAGTTLDLLPLYNQEALEPGCTAIVVENPVDALMVSERTDYTGVATYSVSYWRDKWLEPLRQAKLVIVAYDNDLPGNGGGKQRERFQREWQRNHRGLPQPNGIRLTNRLLGAGIQAVPFDWGDHPHKFDIGALLAKNIQEGSG